MMFLNRRRFVQAASVAVVGGVVSGLLAQPRPEKRQLVVAVEGRYSMPQLPFTIAEQLGYFTAEGLDVKVLEVPSGAAAWSILAAGGADVAAGVYEHVLQQQLRGQWLQAFVLQGRAPQTVLGVSPKSLPGFRGPADLRGRRVGVTAAGSASHRLVQQVMARAGMEAEAVQFVEVGPGWTALNAYRSGQIDALSHIDPVMTTLEQRGEIRVVSDMRSFKETDELFGGPMPSACLYAGEEFVQRHPQTAQALTNALVHALKWLQTAGPSDLIKTVPERLMFGDRALFLAALEKVRDAFTPDGLMPASGPATVLRHLVRFDAGLKPERVDLARSFSNEPARRAKQRFKA